jgi:hypothetical protein
VGTQFFIKFFDVTVTLSHKLFKGGNLKPISSLGKQTHHNMLPIAVQKIRACNEISYEQTCHSGNEKWFIAVSVDAVSSIGWVPSLSLTLNSRELNTWFNFAECVVLLFEN